MLSKNSSFVLKTGETDGSQRFEKLPVNTGMLGTDENGNPIDKSAEMYKVKTNAEDTVPAYLTDKLADTLDIEFNPIEDPENPGSIQLESTIYQLTGKGAALAVRDIPGLAHPEGPGITGFHYGRSCTPGYGYKLNPLSGVKTKSHMWVAQSSNGTLFRSYDNFKTATQDLSLVTYDNTHVAKISTSPYGAQCLAYISMAGGENAWVNFIGEQEGYYILEDIPANYNDDGSIVSDNWVWVDVPGIPQWIGHAVRVTSGGIFVTSSFTAGIYYTADLVTWTKVESRAGSLEVAGISGDSYGTYMAVERDTGILIRNNSEVTGTFDPTAWVDLTAADGFTVTTPDGVTTSVNNLPVTGGAYNGTWWAGLGCAYGLWVCTVARKGTLADPVYAYSDNGIDWITYGGTFDDELITVWDMSTDGALWFGCPVGSASPLVYQLLVNSIPAKKRFIAEKGLMVVGDTFLQDYPDADVLGTDENGKLVAKSIAGHNNLSGLQGGAAGEYYHATAAEYTKLQQLIAGHNNLSGLQGGTSGEYYHATAAEYAKLQQLQVIYDAVVSTSAELQSALESATVRSIYVRPTSSNVDIVLGSGSADQTITLGTSKNIYGQPFTVGSSTSYTTTLALGANDLRCRNDSIDVGGKLTFTGTGTAYIKKLSPSESSNLVVGVAGKLFLENLRTPAAVSNYTINMWDMPLRSGSAASVGDNNILRYQASSGEWTPVALGISSPFGQELFSYATSEDTAAIGSDGNKDTNINATTRGFAFVPAGSVTISKMRISITQTGGTYFRLGIYDSSGKLLGKSARYTTSVGIKEVDLTVGYGGTTITGVTLSGGSVYYMAYWTDDTTQNFKCPILSGRSTSSASPLMQRHSATNQEMPDSIASGASNTALRPWLMISG